MRFLYKYCDFCKIIFELDCIHHKEGYTDNVYDCHFI